MCDQQNQAAEAHYKKIQAQLVHLIDEVTELKQLIKWHAGGHMHVPTASEEIQALKDRGIDIGEHLRALSKAAHRGKTKRKKTEP